MLLLTTSVHGQSTNWLGSTAADMQHTYILLMVIVFLALTMCCVLCCCLYFCYRSHMANLRIKALEIKASSSATFATRSLSPSPTATSPTLSKNPLSMRAQDSQDSGSGSVCHSMVSIKLTPTTSGSGHGMSLMTPNKSHSAQSSGSALSTTLHEEAMAAHHKYNTMQQMQPRRPKPHSWNARHGVHGPVQVQAHNAAGLPLSTPPPTHSNRYNQSVPRPRASTGPEYGAYPNYNYAEQMRRQAQLQAQMSHFGFMQSTSPPLRQGHVQVRVHACPPASHLQVQASQGVQALQGPSTARDVAHASTLSATTMTSINTSDLESTSSSSPSSTETTTATTATAETTPTETTDMLEMKQEELPQTRIERVYTDSATTGQGGDHTEIVTFQPNMGGNQLQVDEVDEREHSYKL